MIDLDSLVRDTKELAPLSPSATRLIGLFADEDWSIEAVVEAASLDGPLLAKILRAANSAAHASANPVSELSEAAMRIGGGAIVGLAAASAVKSCLAEPRSQRGEQEEQSLWRHSVGTALATELLPLIGGVRVRGETYTAALLHDVGRVVLSRHVDQRTMVLLDRAVDEGAIEILEAEHEILGADHAELSAIIAEHWGLPAVIIESLRFHHTPERATTASVETICHAIKLADAAARAIAAPEDEPIELPVECAPSCKHLKLRAEDFPELCRLLRERIDEKMAQYE